jgi:hypothetical protein
MKRLLALLALAPLLACPLGARADLGPAEKIKGEFDAWCGKSGSECKVTFSGDTLAVNGSSTITKSELAKYEIDDKFYCTAASGFSSSKCYGKGSVLIFYNQGGKEGVGAFIFADDNAFFDFQTAVTVFCGAKCRPLGPSVKVQ